MHNSVIQYKKQTSTQETHSFLTNCGADLLAKIVHDENKWMNAFLIKDIWHKQLVTKNEYLSTLRSTATYISFPTKQRN